MVVWKRTKNADFQPHFKDKKFAVIVLENLSRKDKLGKLYFIYHHEKTLCSAKFNGYEGISSGNDCPA